MSKKEKKKRERNQNRLNIHLITPVERVAQRNVKKKDRARFNNAWSNLQ